MSNSEDDWEDITDLLQTTYQGMSPGQLLAVPYYNDRNIMNCWIMMDPKLDPDSLSPPPRIGAVLSVEPPVVSLNPSYDNILHISNYFFSQLAAVHAGSPVSGCIGASLYVHLNRRIESPLLRVLTQVFIKLARRQHDAIRRAALSHEDDYTDCSPKQMAEIDWCDDISVLDVIASAEQELTTLQQYTNYLHHLLTTLLTTGGTQFDFPTAQAALPADIAAKFPNIEQNTAYKAFQNETTQQFNIFEQYLIVNGLNARLRYLYYSWLSQIAVTPLLTTYLQEEKAKQAARAPQQQDDDSDDDEEEDDDKKKYINLINLNAQGLLDSTVLSLNIVHIYNQHLSPLNVYITQQFLSQTAPTTPFHHTFTTALQRFAIPNQPFLSRPSPQPSQIQIRCDFDPFVTYKAIPDQVAPYLNHPAILNDLDAPNTTTTPEQQPGQIKLSTLLPTPCLGLFPYIWMQETTQTNMMRPWEYPSPLSALESLTLSTSKWVTMLTALLSIIPTPLSKELYADPFPKTTGRTLASCGATGAPAAAKPAAAPTKTLVNKQGKVVKLPTKPTPAAAPTSAATAATTPPQPTKPTTLVHFPTYNHIPTLLEYTNIDLTTAMHYDTTTNTYTYTTQPLLPPPPTPYLAYFPLPEQILFIVQAINDLKPSLLLRSFLSAIFNNELDLLGLGRVDAFSEVFLKAKVPSMTGLVELPNPHIPLQVFDDVYQDQIAKKNVTTEEEVAAPTAKPTPPPATSNKNQKQPAQNNKNAKAAPQGKTPPAAQQPPEATWMGYKPSKLSQHQIINLKLSEVYQILLTLPFNHIARQKRSFIDTCIQNLYEVQTEAEGIDSSTWRQMMTDRGFIDPRGAAWPPAPAGIVQWPLYGCMTSIMLQQLIQQQFHTLKLDLVSDKEYFLFLYAIEWFGYHYQFTLDLERRVGTEAGMMGTGPNQSHHSFHFINYTQLVSTRTAAAVENCGGYMDVTIKTKSTPEQQQEQGQQEENNWLTPRSVYNYKQSQQYIKQQSEQFVTPPAIVAQCSVAQKQKYLAPDLRTYLSSFPTNNRSTAQYTELAYDKSTAVWYNPTDTEKPAAQVSQFLPNVSYTPYPPDQLQLLLLIKITKVHRLLLITALRLGVTIPRHPLLKTLAFDNKTKKFNLGSQTDHQLLEYYFSNRYSVTYRTYYPQYRTFKDFMDSTNQYAQFDVEKVLQSISLEVASCQHLITSYNQLYAQRAPDQVGVVRLTRYDAIPPNIILTTPEQQQQQQTNTTITPLDPLFRTKDYTRENLTTAPPVLGIFDAQTLLFANAKKHLDGSVHGVITYLEKINTSKGAIAPGKIDIKLTNYIYNPNHFFANVLPTFVIHEEVSK